MRQPRRIVQRGEETIPLQCRVRIVWHTQPADRIVKRSLRLTAVGDEIELAVEIDVSFKQAMNAVELIVEHPQRPLMFERLVGLFEPENQTGTVTGTDEIEIAIVVDVERFAVNAIITGRFVEDDFSPVWRDEQPRLSAAVADDVGEAVTRAITSDRRHGVDAIMHDVFFPFGIVLSDRRRGTADGESPSYRGEDEYVVMIRSVPDGTSCGRDITDRIYQHNQHGGNEWENQLWTGHHSISNFLDFPPGSQLSSLG